MNEGSEEGTWRYPVIRVYRYILLDLHIVDGLEDGESVPNADDGHFLQFLMP